MWKMCKLPSGCNSLDNDELEADAVSDVFDLLKAQIGKRLSVSSMVGLSSDSLAGEFTVDGVSLTLGWDIWSGVFIMAHDSGGNKILGEISALLMQNY